MGSTDFVCGKKKSDFNTSWTSKMLIFCVRKGESGCCCALAADKIVWYVQKSTDAAGVMSPIADVLK